jgi:hypothetical protein
MSAAESPGRSPMRVISRFAIVRQCRTPGRAKRLIEGVVINVVREAVAKRELTIGRLPFINEPDERVLALEALQPVFDVFLRPLEGCRCPARARAE